MKNTIQLLEQAIERSGLSARAFAKDILWRDERTVRRWLSGESPIPRVVSDRLREELSQKHNSGNAPA